MFEKATTLITSTFSTVPPPGNPGGGSSYGGPALPPLSGNGAMGRPPAPYAGPGGGSGYGGSSGGFGSDSAGSSGGSGGSGAGSSGGAGRARGAPGGSWVASATGGPRVWQANDGSSSSGGGSGAGRPGGGGGGFTSGGGSGSVPTLGRVGGAAADRKYERGLVEDLTAPGGVRAVPDREKLAAFLQVRAWGGGERWALGLPHLPACLPPCLQQAARTLDVATVVALLDERLCLCFPDNDSAGTGASIATKALCVVEALAAAPGCEALKKHLADHCDVMLELLETAGEARGGERYCSGGRVPCHVPC